MCFLSQYYSSLLSLFLEEVINCVLFWNFPVLVVQECILGVLTDGPVILGFIADGISSTLSYQVWEGLFRSFTVRQARPLGDSWPLCTRLIVRVYVDFILL